MNELISQLRQQHEDLRVIVARMLSVAEKTPVPAVEIVSEMAVFRKTLQEHLAIEDSVLYPRLLEVMERDGMDIGVTREFIGQMASIGIKIYSFLDAFALSTAVASGEDVFRTKLHEIAEMLAGRMQAEDRSVYTLYDKLA